MSRTNWGVFVTALGEKLLQNNQSLEFLLVGLWGCKVAALSLIWHNFCVLWGKSSDYMEEADVSKLCRFAPLHPVRCPVLILYEEIIYFN